MYGKHFASMYEGSMVGSGTHVFALMGYVIANYRPDPEVGGQVRLNPTLLATIFGETEKRIQEAIDFLCAPDIHSTTPVEEGRRLVKIGQFDYRVVNAKKYLEIKNEEERREANRVRQANYRDGKKTHRKSKVSPRYLEQEKKFSEALENGHVDLADKIAANEI